MEARLQLVPDLVAGVVGVDSVAGVPGTAGVVGVASRAGMATVTTMAAVADVAVVAAAVLSLHLLMLANRELSVRLPLSCVVRLGTVGDFQSRRGGFTRSGHGGPRSRRCCLWMKPGHHQRPWTKAAVLLHTRHHPPSPRSSRLLRPFRSEQEEVEIALVCTFGLLWFYSKPLLLLIFNLPFHF